MKFTYVDESGNGDEPVLVVAGIVADASRMHITKKEWAKIKDLLFKIVTEFPEWKTASFYSGKGRWKSLDGEKRSQLISGLIQWMKERKHKVHFTAVDKQRLSDIKDPVWGDGLYRNSQIVAWRFTALHYILSLDKYHKKEKGVKGQTVYVFDQAVKDENSLISFLQNPPDWIHSYHPISSKVYKKKTALDTIIDVPYFVDSKHVHMIELADFFAFLLRAFIEVKDKYREQKYKDELLKLIVWSKQIQGILVPRSCRFPSVKKTDINKIFESVAPDCIKQL